MIYFLQPVEGGPVKIGTTEDYSTRFKALQSYYGKPLALLASLPGGRDEEQAIHAQFAHLRLGGKEQFRPAADLMEFIGRPLLVHPDPDAVEVMYGVHSFDFPLFTFEGDFADWLKGVAKLRRRRVQSIIGDALAAWAKANGYQRPPEI